MNQELGTLLLKFKLIEFKTFKNFIFAFLLLQTIIN